MKLTTRKVIANYIANYINIRELITSAI